MTTQLDVPALSIATPTPTMTVQEVAELMRVHETTIHRRIRRGEIYAISIGDLKRIPRYEVERLLGGLPSLTTLTTEERHQLIAEQQIRIQQGS